MGLRNNLKYLSKRIVANDKPFGDYLFGEGLGLPNKKNPEPDTPDEWDIYNMTKDFINLSYGTKIDPSFHNKLKFIKKYEDLYPKVVKPETNKLFRGIKLNPFDAQDYKKTDKTINVKGTTYYYAGKTNYEALSPVESWTKDIKIAHVFTLEDKHDDEVGVIFKATIPYDQIIFNSKYFNNDEKEILRISDVPLVAEVYIAENNEEIDFDDDDWF